MNLRIVAFEPTLRAHFGRLNREWLERHFEVEPIDAEVLDHPEQRILAGGGRILFAVLGDDVVGTCALLQESPGVYELTKMAVTAAHQGAGIGRLLLDAIVDEFRRLGGDTLFLETHSSLKAAISLYERAGFEHRGHKPDSHYARSDTYMVWRDPGAS
ncbi:MAG: GNAT family N-acetyltransferase [Xanthomonadales bacterium]|jgi:ribosomal protein S18 acetylase RimI-like enzyme|nr:GNAT family N-acetyltransferase [Xanthomonadales bacterium]MBP6079581.1 GNAT family N-acetyltransferase [Xanthomonadales bacterium]MBP7625145.1 GNAT family N-acetyltransferase [Xanthomonadales bacterium]